MNYEHGLFGSRGLAAQLANSVYKTLRPRRHAAGHRKRYGREAPPLTTVAEVKTRWGVLRFDTPNEQTAMRARTLLKKEPETIAWIDSFRKDATLYDIGANVGVFSLYAAIRGLRVIAFEPESQNYALLNRNIYLNGLEHLVSAYCVGLSEAAGFTSIYLSGFASGGSLHTVGRQTDLNGQAAPGRFRQGCVSVALDQVIAGGELPPPTHIKIDVDGIEALIIKGAASTLHSPNLRSVCIEINTALPEDTAAIEAIEAAGFVRDVLGKTASNGCRNEIFTRKH